MPEWVTTIFYKSEFDILHTTVKPSDANWKKMESTGQSQKIQNDATSKRRQSGSWCISVQIESGTEQALRHMPLTNL